MHGASTRTLKDHFLDSREQAPNVFINLEKLKLTKREIMTTLYAARNSADYTKKNGYKGGRIILKIKGHMNLIYLNVDDLKILSKSSRRPFISWTAVLSHHRAYRSVHGGSTSSVQHL